MLEDNKIEMKKILLILDIDETLVYATKKALSHVKEDFKVSDYFVYKRPFLHEFLEKCSEHFDIAIWSSADDDYVTNIVRNIVPHDLELQFIWGRSRCTEHFDFEIQERIFIKNLKKIKKLGFDLSKVLIVDDTPQKAIKNYGNVIYPKIFEGNMKDNELRLLIEYLIQFKNIDNVRNIEKRGWKNIKINEP